MTSPTAKTKPQRINLSCFFRPDLSINKDFTIAKLCSTLNNRAFRTVHTKSENSLVPVFYHKALSTLSISAIKKPSRLLKIFKKKRSALL